MSELNRLVDRIQAGDHRIDSESTRINAQIEQRYRREAGTAYDSLIRDKGTTFRYLKHNDTSIRKVAFSLFMTHWTPDALVENVCEEQALHGPADLCVRAIDVLAVIRNKMYGYKVTNSIVEYITSSNIQVDVKAELYFSLQWIYYPHCDRGTLTQIKKNNPEYFLKIIPKVLHDCINAEESVVVRQFEKNTIESMLTYKEAKNLVDQSEFTRAESLLTKSLSLWNSNIGAISLRAKVRFLMKDYSNSMDDWSAAINHSPYVSDFYFERAKLQSIYGNSEGYLIDTAIGKKLQGIG